MSNARDILRVYWIHAKKYPYYVVGLLFAAPLVIILHQIIPPLLASQVLDKLASLQGTDVDILSEFGLLVGLYISLRLVMDSVGWRVVIFLVWRLENLVTRDLARTYNSKLLSLDEEFHADSFGGSLVSRQNKLNSAYIRIADTIVFQILGLATMLAVTSIVTVSYTHLTLPTTSRV